MDILLAGFIVGYSPLIIFDFRNNFYNIKTIFEWLRQGGGEFSLQQFYFLEFLPILTILAARMFHKWKIALVLGLTIFLGWSLINQNQAKGMPVFWNYRDLKVTSEIIINQSGNEFNVINLLSGDTRFYPLRYLLTVGKKAPMDTSTYNKELWVVSYKNYNLKESTAWEMKDANKMKEISRTEINPNIDLIKLE